MAFCNQCGKQLNDGARFCGGCGAAQSADAHQAGAGNVTQPVTPNTGVVNQVSANGEKLKKLNQEKIWLIVSAVVSIIVFLFIEIITGVIWIVIDVIWLITFIIRYNNAKSQSQGYPPTVS